MHSPTQPNPPPRAPAGGHSSGASPPRPGPLDDDYLLMEAIARHDSSALARFYDRHKSVVYSLCLRILRDPGAAEDVMIDVFQEIWTRSDRYSAGRGAPVTYLLMLARSRALDRARVKGAHPAAPLHENEEADQHPHPAPDPLQSALDDERRSMIRHALERLDPKYREVLECSFFDGLSHTEIALKLQKPVGTVKTYLRRGLIQLRDYLRNPDEPPPPEAAAGQEG